MCIILVLIYLLDPLGSVTAVYLSHSSNLIPYHIQSVFNIIDMTSTASTKQEFRHTNNTK